MNRMLNINYAIEVIEGRLNGSSSEVEINKNSNDNTSFTKKIGNRGKVSAVCQKYNIKKYIESIFKDEIPKKRLVKSAGKSNVVSFVSPNPYCNIHVDIFGFMMLKSIEIDKEEYDSLDDNNKLLFVKSGKKYKNDFTKKRIANLQMSSLINVSNKKIEKEFNICSTTTDNMLYNSELYSGIMSGIANFNISNVGMFNISDVDTEFRDYSISEGEMLGVKNLTKEEKLDRINKVLKALEYMSIKGNQSNHLTDTKPKFVIMGDYGWGNNVFQGVINKNGLDIDMLLESIEQNEEYRLSNIYIGVNNFFDKDNNLNLETLKNEFKDYDFIKVDNVHNTFKNYFEELKNNL